MASDLKVGKIGQNSEKMFLWEKIAEGFQTQEEGSTLGPIDSQNVKLGTLLHVGQIRLKIGQISPRNRLRDKQI